MPPDHRLRNPVFMLPVGWSKCGKCLCLNHAVTGRNGQDDGLTATFMTEWRFDGFIDLLRADRGRTDGCQTAGERQWLK